MKFKSISLLLVSAFAMNAQSPFNWLGCIQKIFPTYQCVPAPVPKAQYTVNPPNTVSCVPQTSGSLYYNKIQDAVNVAPAGSSIIVCPGTYPEQVVITKPLTIVGVPVNGSLPMVTTPASFGPTILPTGKQCYPIAASLQDGQPAWAQIAVVGSCTVNISNIVVIGPGGSTAAISGHVFGIYYQNASGTITANHVEEEYLLGNPGIESGYAIFAESGAPVAAQGGGSAGSANVIISNNNVVDFQAIGIAAVGGNTTATVTGNNVGFSALPSLITSTTVPNGIEFENAAGSICTNSVTNMSSTSGFASVGIWNIASNLLTISGNTVTAVDAPILVTSDISTFTSSNPNGTADNNTITSNTVSGTGFKSQNALVSDGIDICSNSNNVSGNVVIVNPAVSGAGLNSGVHLDSTCPGAAGTTEATSGSYNFVEFNLISGSSVGIAEGGNYNNVWYNSVDGSEFAAVYPGDFYGTTETTKGNFNLDDVLNNPLGQSLNQLLEQIFAPQLLIRKH